MLNETVPQEYAPVQANSMQIPPAKHAMPQHTTESVMRLVDYAVGRLSRRYRLQEADIQDLRQDGYIAGLDAFSRFKAGSGAFSSWILRRVHGELSDRLKRLRSGGLTGRGSGDFIGIDHAASLEDGEANDMPGGTGPDVISLLDTIPDERSISPEQGAAMSEMLMLAHEKLSAQDYAILLAYHGVGRPPQTIRQLAATFGMSSTRVHFRLTRAHECLGRIAMGDDIPTAEQNVKSAG